MLQYLLSRPQLLRAPTPKLFAHQRAETRCDSWLFCSISAASSWLTLLKNSKMNQKGYFSLFGDARHSPLLDKQELPSTARKAIAIACKRVDGMQTMDPNRLVLWDFLGNELPDHMPLKNGGIYFIHGRKSDSTTLWSTVKYADRGTRRTLKVPYPPHEQYISCIRDYACMVMYLDSAHYSYNLFTMELRLVDTWKLSILHCGILLICIVFMCAALFKTI